jgi:PhoPQ-activated pathogenicity-related protein
MSWKLWIARLANSLRIGRRRPIPRKKRRRSPGVGPRSLYGPRLSVDALEDRTLLSVPGALPATTMTALDAYVAAPDPAYKFSLNSTLTGSGYIDYVVNMTSQTWRSPAEVTPNVWQHWLEIIVPIVVKSKTAVLEIGGGSSSALPPTSPDSTGVLTATSLDAITVVLPDVPNEPLLFAGQSSSFTEDQIVAYSFNQYLDGGDQNWPLLLPMVESAVRAMDTAQTFVSEQTSGALQISNFIVSGASKRGWTTWLVPAVDSRIVGIVPFVFDALNFPISVPYQLDTYVGVTQDIIGGFSSALEPYTDLNIFGRLDSPEGAALDQIVDPYAYLNRPSYDIPKYLVDSTGDQFFAPDAQLYFSDLPGENYIRYVPNTDHSLNQNAVNGAINFEDALLEGLPLPQFSWSVANNGATIDVNSVTKPVSVTMWQATNPSNRDFRLETFGANWTSSPLTSSGGGNYVATIIPPGTGASAFFVQMVYNVDGLTLTFTTTVSTVPLFAPVLTVSDPSGQYNGKPFAATATATGLYGESIAGILSVAYYVGKTPVGSSSPTAPTIPGTYTVVATFTSQDPSYENAQSAVTFTISPATPTIVVQDASGLFTGQPFTATATATGITGQPVSGTLAFTYYEGTSASGNGSSSAPVNPGTYTALATFTSADPDYANASAPVTFTIETTAWTDLGGNPQHTGTAVATAQALQAIHWQTPVDLDPQYDSGGELLIHYGSPVITAANTVIVPVKTGASNGWELEAFNGATGAVKWTLSTDYLLPPEYDWTPEYGPVLANGRLYFAGAGGTLFYITNPDATGSHTVNRVAFYGINNYNANPAAYANSVFISTPLTTDANGDVFFGYRVFGSNPLNIQSGIARINASGNGTYTSAYAASGGDSQIADVPYNAAPAVSLDGSTIYVSVASSSQYYGYLVALNSTTLQLETNSSGGMARTFLYDPRDNNANPAGLLDDSSGVPVVAPDGTVYYGVFGNPYNGSRGFLLHFSADLSTEYTPGAFGWDDTISIVPASMVPSYHGNSSYLVMSKYNNYAADDDGGLLNGGNGINQIAILDPNATEPDTRNDGDPNLLVMNEVETITGPTPDPSDRNSQYPYAVHEWCIDDAVVDPGTDSVYAGSEDGKLYQWNLATNTFTAVVTLTPGLGEAYTPTLIGPDGTVYAINNATLFAVGKGQAQPAPISLSATTLNFGNQPVGTTSAAPKSTTMIIPGVNVNFESVSFSGTNAADFNLLNPPTVNPNALPPGPLQFSFTPSQLGAESATCTLTTDQSIVTVTLSGTGTSAVSQTGGTLSFGSQTVGTTSQNRSTMLVNLGAGISVVSITASGANPADFTLLNPPALGPLAQGTQVLNFAFKPSIQGAESATYTIQTSAGSVAINLSGTGAASAKQAAVFLSGTNVMFGSQAVGVMSEVVTETLTNLGTAGTVQFQSITTSGNNVADFKLLNPPVIGTLPPGSEVLQFTFTASKTGGESATYTFHTSAGNVSMSLSGSGSNPLLLSATGVNFGSTALTTEASQALTLTNLDGGGHVQLLSITGSGTNVADFPIISAPAIGTLAGGAQSIVFGFRPSKTGSESATYVISTSAGSFTVSLKGSGIQPVSLATARINLGSVPVHTTTEQEATTLVNLGNVTIQSITISGTNPADFSVANIASVPLNQALTPGESVPLTFTFTASQTATESATVTIVTSAGTLTLQLSGVGLPTTV